MTIDSIQKQALFFLLDELENKKLSIEKVSSIAKQILEASKNMDNSPIALHEMITKIHTIPELQSLVFSE